MVCQMDGARRRGLFLGVGIFLEKLQGRGVDAKAKASGRGTVVEDVSEVGIAAAAHHLGAAHSVAGVAIHFDIIGGDRLVVARPTRAGMELGIGGEKRLAAADAHVCAFCFRILVFPGEGWFRSFFARDMKLLVR